MLLSVNRVTVARWEAGGAVGPTAGPWLEALEAAWRAVFLHADNPPQRFVFLDELTPDKVPWAWARLLALAHPEADADVANIRSLKR